MWGRLAKKGVIGLNGRNSELIMRYNKRKFYPLVDNKLATKRLALEAGIAVPELYAVIENQPQSRAFLSSGSHTDFVIKPSRGSGGEGIVVVTGASKTGFRKADGVILSKDYLADHITRILGGLYSLGGHPDKVMVEYRVRFDPVFKDVSYLGVPDVRIIVFKGVPVMAMLRLPSRQSQGKANLHQGAVGVGVDIGSGVTSGGVWLDQPCSEHPDTGVSLAGIQVPRWDEFLELAARCYELTGLGYQGVDLVLDENLGPLLLELNARPGLAIQLANREGIGLRTSKVEACPELVDASIGERLAFARLEFSRLQKAFLKQEL